MKQTYVFICMLCMLSSCSSIKSIAEKEGNLPFIGTLGKEKTSVLKTRFIPIGNATLVQPISLTVQSTQFTKKTYNTYLTAKELNGAEPTITYTDSLELKPTYIVLNINDKVGVIEALNKENNTAVKSYLEKDSDYRLVSSVSIATDVNKTKLILNSESIFLSTDANGKLQLELVNQQKREVLFIANNELFDYEIMGFCWGVNRYGKPILETINENGRCPEGLAKDAKKIDKLPSLLKL